MLQQKFKNSGNFKNLFEFLIERPGVTKRYTLRKTQFLRGQAAKFIHIRGKEWAPNLMETKFSVFELI